MEGAVLSTPNNNRLRMHLKNAASALCARTLPKQRRSEPAASSTVRHHTYPRTTPKRAAIFCLLEAPCDQPQQIKTFELPEPKDCHFTDVHPSTVSNGIVKLKGSLAREVANAWGYRVGTPDVPAPAEHLQNLFNDIELYPTKTQVFEMLVCARQCARRQSLSLTFGEFCVFAAELRRWSRQTRQNPTKPESPNWSLDKELRDLDAICKHVNGSEASLSPCEVFLGGSCNPTTWRSDIAIPMLKKMGITYFNPQVEDWSTELVEVEHRAKASARALLFVLDSETRAVAASVEVAHLAAAPKDLLLVLRPYARHQNIANETISDQEYVELARARATLQEAVERRGLPAFTDIPAALRCARDVIRGARTNPRYSLGHTIMRLKRAFDAAGSRNGLITRSRAVDVLKDVTRVRREVADRCLPPSIDTLDFETFCASVAELAADVEWQSRNGQEAEAVTGATVSAERRMDAQRDTNGRHVPNARLRAYGRKLPLYIPKSNVSRSGEGEVASAESGSSGESLFTPGTERRLERLPAMLGAPTHDVYLGGAFPSQHTRPEEILRREGFTYVIPRANDYTRMFSAPARRSAPAHPESPRHDKKPRPATATPAPTDDDVQLREKPATAELADRLSASDFYTVTEDITPQPFTGTYDEALLLGSRLLVFSMSSEAPCFPAMVLAAHYMGLRPKNTVLLVQPMLPPQAGAHSYSETAVKDYNRGRHYITDLARRSNVPVFDNVNDTMACVLSRLRSAL
ncbi:uncharacterized protein LOC113233443 isoform X2 [Hyposmocoma kahamanoa]|uniref:uncharacterized protein LOC113233443 isoform X2 n=1 Tax=Hyposmocoma kahamanoa TaxID=1477025 RepID=UPI000E6D9E26|nr:uncharacterized protein LOC113233443 isoform X2 [Hyposmocoma kahamanoa]